MLALLTSHVKCICRSSGANGERQQFTSKDFTCQQQGVLSFLLLLLRASLGHPNASRSLLRPVSQSLSQEGLMF